MFKSVEVVLPMAPVPKHGPLVRDHQPVRSKDEFERELSGFVCEFTWESAIEEMRKEGVTAMWFVAHKN